MILGAISLGIWQYGLPIFAPSVLNAIAPAAQDGEVEGGSAGMSSRLAQALDMVARGSNASLEDLRSNEWTSGAAYDAPVHVDEEALLAMIDESVAEEEREAWQEEAEQAQVAMEMAEQLMSRGKYADAQMLLRRVLAHSPSDAQAHYKLGLACVMRRDFGGAREELKALRKLDASLASLLANLVPRSSEEQ